MATTVVGLAACDVGACAVQHRVMTAKTGQGRGATQSPIKRGMSRHRRLFLFSASILYVQSKIILFYCHDNMESSRPGGPHVQSRPTPGSKLASIVLHLACVQTTAQTCNTTPGPCACSRAALLEWSMPRVNAARAHAPYTLESATRTRCKSSTVLWVVMRVCTYVQCSRTPQRLT